MSHRKHLLAGAMLLAALTFGLVQAGEQTGQPTAKATRTSDRQADRDAIRASVNGFSAAFQAGDGSKAATFLAEGAELIPDSAPPVRGRKAIQDLITGHFAKHAKQHITLDVDIVRFLSRDSAIEEGHIKSSVDNMAPTSQRYSILLVREDGKWLLAGIREWPGDNAEILDLGWLVGSWSAKRADTEVKATYEWVGNRAFIRGDITTRQNNVAVSVMQVIGLDPQSGDLHIWIFESDGGFAQGTCVRERDTWVFETQGVQADGGELSAKNILLRVNKDVITWQPVNLVVNGERVSDLPPIKVTRTK